MKYNIKYSYLDNSKKVINRLFFKLSFLLYLGRQHRSANLEHRIDLVLVWLRFIYYALLVTERLNLEFSIYLDSMSFILHDEEAYKGRHIIKSIKMDYSQYFSFNSKKIKWHW